MYFSNLNLIKKKCQETLKTCIIPPALPPLPATSIPAFISWDKQSSPWWQGRQAEDTFHRLHGCYIYLSVLRTIFTGHVMTTHRGGNSHLHIRATTIASPSHITNLSLCNSSWWNMKELLTQNTTMWRTTLPLSSRIAIIILSLSIQDLPLWPWKQIQHTNIEVFQVGWSEW